MKIGAVFLFATCTALIVNLRQLNSHLRSSGNGKTFICEWTLPDGVDVDTKLHAYFKLKMPNSRRKNKTLVSYNGNDVKHYLNDFFDASVLRVEPGEQSITINMPDKALEMGSSIACEVHLKNHFGIDATPLYAL